MKKIILYAIITLLQSHTFSQNAPLLINYQALLKDNNGYPINGNVSITFRMYDSLVAGNLLWNETQNNIVSQNGIINTNLGVSTPLNQGHFIGGKCFLEIDVAGYGKLSPRVQFTSVPFAIRSSNDFRLLKYSTAERQISGNPQATITILDTVFAASTVTEFIKVEFYGGGNYLDIYCNIEVQFGTASNLTSYGYRSLYGYVNNRGPMKQYAAFNIPIKLNEITEPQRILIKATSQDGYVSSYHIFGK